MELVQSWAVWIASIVAGLAAIGWLLRTLMRGVRTLDRLERVLGGVDTVVNRELTHNGGQSIKDATSLMRELFPVLVRRVDALESAVQDVLVPRVEALESAVQQISPSQKGSNNS